MALTIKIEYANKNIGSRSCQEKHRELFYLFIYLFIYLLIYCQHMCPTIGLTKS